MDLQYSGTWYVKVRYSGRPAMETTGFQRMLFDRYCKMDASLYDLVDLEMNVDLLPCGTSESAISRSTKRGGKCCPLSFWLTIQVLRAKEFPKAARDINLV
jgi:hypothetical protein